MKTDRLEEIYRAYYRDVYLYALSLSRDIQVAEDITSDTFFKALFSLDMQTVPVKFWLLRVCKNLFMDLCRKNKKLSAEPIEEFKISVCDEVLEKMIKREDMKELYRAVMRLPDKYREVICMFYYMDCSISEIARLTGQSQGAVKTALSRARVKLKHLIESGEQKEEKK